MNNTTKSVNQHVLGPKLVSYDYALFTDEHREEKILFDYSRLPENQSLKPITSQSFYSNNPHRNVSFNAKHDFIQVFFDEHMYTFKVKFQHEVNNLCTFFDV